MENASDNSAEDRAHAPRDGVERPVVAGIGASAGGIDALKSFFGAMPDDGGVAIVVVQHADAQSGALLLEAMSKLTRMPVTFVSNPTTVRANCVFVADPASVLSIEDGVLRPRAATSDEQRHNAIDEFFRSLARAQGETAIGIVLSGIGTDGTLGLRAIREAGGMTMAQDPASAKYDTMPQSAAAIGAVDHVFPPKRMPAELVAYAHYIEDLRSADSRDEVQADIEGAIDKICDLLRRETGQDFKQYKTNMLARRIQRRMHVLRLHNTLRYVELLEEQRSERHSLFTELLIGVTAFFRDPDAFDALAELVIPNILGQLPNEHPIRIWVPGCASGEESYSIAILFLEAMEARGVKRQVQIFATDIDERAIAIARKGVYAPSIVSELTPERLERFFIKQGSNYAVAKSVRDLCSFSVHNLISDPPFSHLDLISCRNLLIYLGEYLQKTLIPVFHYALRENGYLMLGPSENLARHTDLFRTISLRHRISQRGQALIASTVQFPARARGVRLTESTPTHAADLGSIAQRIVHEEFTPAYALVHEDGQIVYLSEKVNRYLEPPVGAFHGYLMKMARSGLKLALRAAFADAIRTRKKAVQVDVAMPTAEGLQRVMLTVQPVPRSGEDSGLFLVIFQSLGPPAPRTGAKSETFVDDGDDIIEQLEHELATTRDELESAVQDLETANEELKSSNEELLSMNEELQSGNEELETSKDELQQANEALARSNSDISNLLKSTQIATIFLDETGNLRDFTPAVSQVYNLIRADIGRPIAHTTHRFIGACEFPDQQEVKHASAPIETELQTVDGRWFLRRATPYFTSDVKTDGIVITFLDITRLKRTEQELRESERRFRLVADSAPMLIWESGPDKQCTWFNRAWLDFTGRTMEEERGDGWTKGVHPNDLARCMDTYVTSFDRLVPFAMEYRMRHHDGAWRWILDHGVPRFDSHGAFLGYIGSAVDIEDRKRGERRIRESEQHFRLLADTIPQIVWTASADGVRDYYNARWYELTGLPAGEALEDEWLQALHQEDRARCAKAWRAALRSGEPYQVECRCWVPATNAHRWYLARAVPVKDPQGQVLSWVGTLTDIDDRKQLEAERELLLDAERAARAEIVRVARLKDEFLATLSHELRTPLHAILGWVQVLRKGKLGENELDQGIEVIERNARLQARLIADLLDVSRIISGRIRLDLALVDPKAVVTSVIESLAPSAAEKQIKLEVQLAPGEPVLHADEARLEQVVWNLVSNSIKFTPRGGTVGVELTCDDDLVVLTVRDTGVGIAGELLPHVFERFRQADASVTRRQGGLGLGLAIVKQLVELHNGRVDVYSEGEGRGTTFTIELPRAQAEAIAAHAARNDGTMNDGIMNDGTMDDGPAKLVDLSGARILVVDDEADSRELVGRILEGAGASVTLAAEGVEALDKLSQFDADVLISDIGLPGEDGYRLLGRLRTARARALPAVAVTAFVRPEDRQRAVEAGFEAHLAKPLEPSKLLLTVTHLLGRDGHNNGGPSA